MMVGEKYTFICLPSFAVLLEMSIIGAVLKHRFLQTHEFQLNSLDAIL